MSDLAAAIRQAEEALAQWERTAGTPAVLCGLNMMGAALRSLLSAAREAEADLITAGDTLLKHNHEWSDRCEEAEAALAEERQRSAKAERRAEKVALALTRAHEVIAQQRSLIDPEQYPEIDAAAGDVIDPCDEFADRMDRAEAEVRTLAGERDRLREQLAEERRRREEAERHLRTILDNLPGTARFMRLAKDLLAALSAAAPAKGGE